MRSWWELYKKEIHSISFFMLIVFLIILGWELFLFYKMATWPLGLVFGLSFIPFSIFPLLQLWLGYNSYRQEWKDETIYFLLTLPRAGWQLNLSKLVAGITFYFGATTFTGIMVYFIYHQRISEMLTQIPSQISMGLLLNYLIKSIIIYLLTGTMIYVLSQFSLLISKFYNRLQGIISIVCFIVTGYLIFRGGSLLAPVFKWIPDIPVTVFNETFAGVKEFTIYIGTGPLVASMLLLIGVFITGSFVLEKYLEV